MEDLRKTPERQDGNMTNKIVYKEVIFDIVAQNYVEKFGTFTPFLYLCT